METYIQGDHFPNRAKSLTIPVTSKWYSDGAGNTNEEENSSIFSLIQVN